MAQADGGIVSMCDSSAAITDNAFVVVIIINSFQVFDQVYIMTAGGPARSTSVLVHYLYQNARVFQNGASYAIAYVLFFMVLIITLLQLRKSKSWVVYS